MTHDEFAGLAVADAFGGAELWPDEARDHLRECEACKRELREMQEIGGLIGLAAPPAAPPGELRQSVIASALPLTGDLPEEVRRGRGRVWWLASAATFFLALWGWNEMRLHAAREQLQTVETDRRILAEENRRLQQRPAPSSSALATIAARDALLIALKPPGDSSPASARLFISKSHRSAVALFAALPPSAVGRCYQIWLLRLGSSAPESGGTFTVPANGYAEIELGDLQSPETIRAIAVTLEPAGGSPGPTGPRVLEGTV